MLTSLMVRHLFLVYLFRDVYARLCRLNSACENNFSVNSLSHCSDNCTCSEVDLVSERHLL